MRGSQDPQSGLFSYVAPDRRVPADHPLRIIKAVADDVLKTLSPTFTAMYSPMGRPSIPPERLLKAQLLIALYSVRGHRLFCEPLDYNILFRWFLDMSLDELSFDASTFSQNQERLLQHAVAQKFFDAVIGMARSEALLSDEHFTVDGTLIEAWASLKSVQPTDTPAPRRTIPATRPSISVASGGPTLPTGARPTPRPAWPARGRARKPSWRSVATS
jgi:transposase